jgi:hypothetical protein
MEKCAMHSHSHPQPDHHPWTQGRVSLTLTRTHNSNPHSQKDVHSNPMSSPDVLQADTTHCPKLDARAAASRCTQSVATTGASSTTAGHVRSSARGAVGCTRGMRASSSLAPSTPYAAGTAPSALLALDPSTSGLPSHCLLTAGWPAANPEANGSTIETRLRSGRSMDKGCEWWPAGMSEPCIPGCSSQTYWCDAQTRGFTYDNTCAWKADQMALLLQQQVP